MAPFMLEGRSAYSPFRLEALAQALAARLPSMAGATIQATWVYLLDLARPMDPETEGRTRYYWFQMRNFSPDDAEVSAKFAASVRQAFEEDRVIMQAVHRGMADKRSPNIDLKIDLGPLRFRQRLAQMIAAEQAPAEKPRLAVAE